MATNAVGTNPSLEIHRAAGQFQEIGHERRLVRLIIERGIVRDRRHIHIVPHAAAYIFFVFSVGRNRKQIRRWESRSRLFPLIVQVLVILLKLGNCRRWRLDNQRVVVFASFPLRVIAAEIDAASVCPKHFDCQRYGSNLAFNALNRSRCAGFNAW